VNGDTTVEPDEQFSVDLSKAQNATVADGSGTGTITNDDTASPPPTQPSVSIGNASVAEGNSGEFAETFKVSLDHAFDQDVKVDYNTTDGTAVAPDDYASTAGTATIPAGQTKTTVTVPVNGDMAKEGKETYTTDLSNPQNATIGDPSGDGVIRNDDTNVDTTASNARGDRVRAAVSTTPQAGGDTVRIYREIAGDDPVMYRGTLDDSGRVSTVVDKDFAPGATVKLYAKVVTDNGTYQSETSTVVVD
jgi:hypothetical protein